MLMREKKNRPEPWQLRKQRNSIKWLTPLICVEWTLEWIAYFLSHWSLLEVLEYLGTFSVLIAVIFYFSESGDRIKQRHYQAWLVINTAQGKGGNGGRIEALEELNADKVPLVGVDVSSAFLQGLNLEGASLLRADFSSADLRNSKLARVDFTLANLNYANLRDSELNQVKFVSADLSNADLSNSNLTSADLTGAVLDEADFSGADLNQIQWQKIKSIQKANLVGVRNPPQGFLEWAQKQGALTNSPPQ